MKPAHTRHRRLFAAGLAALTLSLTLADTADAARRGGSFGSRGSRTFQSSRPMFGSSSAAPITRSMSAPRAPGAAAQRPGFNAPGMQQRPGGGFLRRWGGPILGGLALGGLVGMLMGHGFGGAAGFMGMLLQIALVAGAAWLFVRLLRGRGRPAGASAFSGPSPAGFGSPPQPSASPFGASSAFSQPPAAWGGLTQGQAQGQGWTPGFGASASQTGRPDELGLGQSDIDAMEQVFLEVQAAYAAEDYGRVRDRSTPEIMSFLAEELGTNASEGRRNEIRDIRVVNRELTESWREDEGDYATLGVRFTSLDWMVDRATNQVVAGDPARPIETAEYWTFVRPVQAFGAAPWKVTAIQETAAA